MYLCQLNNFFLTKYKNIIIDYKTLLVCQNLDKQHFKLTWKRSHFLHKTMHMGNNGWYLKYKSCHNSASFWHFFKIQKVLAILKSNPPLQSIKITIQPISIHVSYVGKPSQHMISYDIIETSKFPIKMCTFKCTNMISLWHQVEVILTSGWHK